MDNKKILILYATAGAGHKKAAEAIFHEAKNRSLDVELVDIIAYMPPFMARLYSDGYALLITRLVWLWAILYYISDAAYLSPINVHLRKFMNARSFGKLIEFLKNKKPNIVISTHFLASEIVSYAKQKFGVNSKLISIVTDFEVHNFWIAPETNVYCCATDATKQILIKKGVPESLIKITGIPVDPKFLTVQDREHLIQEFKLKEGLFTILIVTGGIGAGPIEEIVELLEGDAQLLVVCGNNKKLFESLEQKKFPNVRVFGFVDYMQKLMKVSDCIITKAGGLTITECLTMGLPMIFFYLIPGQEEKNAKTMAAYGAGVIALSLPQIKAAALRFKNDPKVRESFKNAAISLARPDSCQEILSHL
ncbi:MAG: glycosyltransferase [Candidatus Omnitrophota bacterium]